MFSPAKLLSGAVAVLVVLAACKPEKVLTHEEVVAQFTEEQAADYAQNAAISNLFADHTPMPRHDETWPDYRSRMENRRIVFEFELAGFSQADGDLLAREELTVLTCDDGDERMQSVSFDSYDPAKIDAILEAGLEKGLFEKDVLTEDDAKYDILDRFSINNTKRYMLDVLDPHPGMMSNLSGFVTRYLENGEEKRVLLLSMYFSC